MSEASASRRRQRRADAVRRLAERPGTDGDPRWASLDWDALGVLPPWCALDEASREELRDLAGAASLLSSVRRCVRGDVLLALRTRIGAQRLEALRTRPYRDGEGGAELVEPARLEAQLAARGARALCAALDDPLSRELLNEVLRGDAVRAEEGAPDEIGSDEDARLAERIAAGLRELPRDVPAREDREPASGAA